MVLMGSPRKTPPKGSGSQPRKLTTGIPSVPTVTFLRCFRQSSGFCTRGEFVALFLAVVCPAEMAAFSSDEISGGISNFELMFNFVGITASPLPRVLDKKGLRPEYRDPLRDAAADLIPISVWDAVRLLEHTITFARKILHVELVPEGAKAQRTFLWRYGYKKLLGGLSVRPVLPEQATHAAKMMTAVKDGQLQMFQPFNNSAPVWRQLTDDDLVPHVDRVRMWRRLDGHGRKRS